MMIDRTSDFMTHSATWRIEAVLHDGSWYTLGKWAKLAKVKKPLVQDWIDKNADKVNLINVNDSYRVNYDEVERWYFNQKGISTQDRIVPNNFPPKIWDNQTEVEALINTPRRKVTEVTITPNSPNLLKKCKKILKGVAIVRLYRNGTYRACGLSPTFIERTLRRGLTNDEYKIVKPGRKTIMHYRELSDFSDTFLNNALQFYVPFARTMLRSRMSTLKIYLPTKNDIDMQIAMWVMIALRKFDERQSVPFSGYLSRVLAFWPYDLPDEALGKELSSFQRNRQKIINKLIRKDSNMVIPENTLIEKMNISKDEYLRLDKEYQSWLSEHNASELTWKNSTNERKGILLWTGHKDTPDPKLSHAISVGICKAALKTKDYHEAIKIIKTIDSNNQNDYKSLIDVDPKFKDEMWKTIKEIIAVDDSNE